MPQSMSEAYERRHGAMAAETDADDPGVTTVRELLETRYRHLDDPEIVEGMPLMLQAARERMRTKGMFRERHT